MKKSLNEIFNYTYPKNAYVKFWDFYALELLNHQIKIENLKDVGQSFLSPRERLQSDITYAYEKIVNDLFTEMYLYLKKEIVHEFRHITNYSKLDEIIEDIEDNISDAYVYSSKHQNEQQIKNEIEKYKKKSAKQLNIPLPLLNKLRINRRYIYDKNISLIEIYHLFNANIKWVSAYGGKPWATATKVFLEIDNIKDTNNINKKAYYIDRVYDMEHNTGTLLNKTNKLFVDKQNLDYRAKKVKSLRDLYFRHTGGEVKQLIRRFYNLTKKTDNSTTKQTIGEHKTMKKTQLKNLIKECIREEIGNGIQTFKVDDTENDLNIRDLQDKLNNPPVEWAEKNYPGGISAYKKMIHDKIRRMQIDLWINKTWITEQK